MCEHGENKTRRGQLAAGASEELLSEVRTLKLISKLPLAVPARVSITLVV